MYITSDLIDYNDSNNLSKDIRNDNIKFSFSIHYNSIPFSKYIGLDPNIVNITDEDILKSKLYNNFANLGLSISEISNKYGTLKIKCSSGEEINLS